VRSETFPVGPSPTLVLRLGSGSVQVVEGRVGQILVEASGKGEEGLRLEAAGDRVVVAQTRQGLVLPTVEVRIAAPPGVAVEAGLASCDMTISLDASELRASLASGDLRAGRVSGMATVKTASGDVVIDSTGDRLVVNAASGDVRVGRADGDVRIVTASGDISIDWAGGTVEVKSASGDTRVGHFDGARLSAHTVSGDVSVGMAPGRRVDLDVVSHSGDVRLPQPATLPGSAEGEGARAPGPRPEQLRTRLTFRSVSGDFVLRRIGG